MNKLFWLMIIFLIPVLFFQCQKDLSYTGGPDARGAVLPDPITASIQGNITDENNQPATGVMVTAGTSTTITDANGYFHFTNASLDKNTTLITAQKDGYFEGYRVLAATSGCNQVAIKMIKKNIAGTIAASSGGDATLANSTKITLPANGVVTASSNASYNGDVKVYASYIDPSSSDIGKIIPGSLTANDKNGKRVVLASYGMLAVELTSVNGEKLQIKNGSKATLTIPIPSGSLSSAPITISLWYIDEATGIWQEEGTATKQGSNYVGEVKHFSYWNCDYPYDAVNLSFSLHTPDDLPVVNAYTEIKVIATDSASGGAAHGYTDSLGQVKGLVPANKNLKLMVYDPCGNMVYSQDIAPISSSKDLGTIKVNSAASLLTFTGILLNCNNTPVTNGYALINFDGTTRYAATDANGKFITTYAVCAAAPATATVLGVDMDASQQGDVASVSISVPLTNAGNITSCGVSISEYINYTLDGTDYIIDGRNESDSAINGYLFNGIITSINGYDTSSNYHISFTVLNATTAGTYPLNSLLVQGSDSTVLMQPFNITFTKYPAVAGEFYEGNFSGNYTQSAVSHSISATFRARRNY